MKDILSKKGVQWAAGIPLGGLKNERVSSDLGEGGVCVKRAVSLFFFLFLCFAGAGTRLPDVPRSILHLDVTHLSGIYPRSILYLDVTDLSGIYPSGLGNLLTVPHIMMPSLSSFLAVQVTVNFLLKSLNARGEIKSTKSHLNRRKPGRL